MTNQRVSRAQHLVEASRALPLKRGEKPCSRNHDVVSVREGGRCDECGAAK